MARIPVVANVLAKNDQVARDIRSALRPDTLVLNLLSSPGAGKTTLIERTAAALKRDLRLAVIEGDLATTLDAERVAAHGVPVVQINTGGDCHLEARHIMAALPQLPLSNIDVLLIENVGNLICPTEFDLGEDVKVIITSLTEGDDKPLKYPHSFAVAQIILINKVDLEPHLPVSVERLRTAIATVNAAAPVIVLSAWNGYGMQAWLDWVGIRLAAKRATLAATIV